VVVLFLLYICISLANRGIGRQKNGSHPGGFQLFANCLSHWSGPLTGDAIHSDPEVADQPLVSNYLMVRYRRMLNGRVPHHQRQAHTGRMRIPLPTNNLPTGSLLVACGLANAKGAEGAKILASPIDRLGSLLLSRGPALGYVSQLASFSLARWSQCD
jgi:hypothetical protein